MAAGRNLSLDRRQNQWSLQQNAPAALKCQLENTNPTEQKSKANITDYLYHGVYLRSLANSFQFCDVSGRWLTEASGKVPINNVPRHWNRSTHTHTLASFIHTEKHIMCLMFVKVNEILKNVKIQQCYFTVITSDGSVFGECSFVFHRRKLQTDLDKSIFLLILSSFLSPFPFIPMNSITMSMRQTTLNAECCPNAFQHKDWINHH